MLTIFINDRPLVFLHKDQKPHSSQFKIIVYEDATAIEEAVYWLSNGQYAGVNLICDDVTACFEEFKEPYHYIPAAGGVVTNNLGELLMIYRLGKWDLPKGKLEKNESVADAAVREVEEECGITGPVIIAPMPSTFHTYLYKGKPALKESFWFNMKYSGNEPLVPQTEEDITAIKWVPLNELATLLPKSYAAIAHLIENYYLPKA